MNNDSWLYPCFISKNIGVKISDNWLLENFSIYVAIWYVIIRVIAYKKY